MKGGTGILTAIQGLPHLLLLLNSKDALAALTHSCLGSFQGSNLPPQGTLSCSHILAISHDLHNQAANASPCKATPQTSVLQVVPPAALAALHLDTHHESQQHSVDCPCQ